MKVFITGGTGLIGRHLIPELIDKKHDVYVLSRNQEKAQKKLGDKVTVIAGNPTESGPWMDELANMDAVVNLVGENILRKRWTRKQKIKLLESRVESKNNIFKALDGHMLTNPNKKYTLISPSGVDYYPSSKTREFTELDPPADNFIGDLCKNWEPNIKHLELTNIRTVVYRIGVVFTRTGRGAELMFLPHKFFVGSWLGNGKQHFSFIHIEDLVGSIIWAIENDEVKGVFNAVCPETASLKETAKIGGKIMGRWTWLFLPGFVLRILLGKRADLILKGRKVSSNKIQEAGYKFLYPTIEDTLIDILGKKK